MDDAEITAGGDCDDGFAFTSFHTHIPFGVLKPPPSTAQSLSALITFIF